MSERDVDIDITILPQREDPEITIIVEPDDITDNHLSDAELIKSIRVLEVDLNADASGELTIPTLQENQAAAEQFCTQLRRNWPQFDTQHKFNHYENEPRDKWFAISDLVAAADALDIPMAVQIVGGNHYCLVLTTPKFNDEDKKWHYRLYDPMDDREKSYAFEAVSANYDDFRTKNQHLGTSKKADSLFKTDGYDLTFDDDSQLSERQSILRAKTGRVQFNAHDCGPLCLFAAILRLGATNKSSLREQLTTQSFVTDDLKSESSLDRIERLTGVRFLTRDRFLPETLDDHVKLL